MPAQQWTAYFLRLYRASQDGFDREACRLRRQTQFGSRHATPEHIRRLTHNQAKWALFQVWEDAIARYPGEWQEINQGYYGAIHQG